LVCSSVGDAHLWVSAPPSSRPVVMPLAGASSRADEWRWRPEIFFPESEGIYHRRALEAWNPLSRSGEFRSSVMSEVAGSQREAAAPQNGQWLRAPTSYGPWQEPASTGTSSQTMSSMTAGAFGGGEVSSSSLLRVRVAAPFLYFDLQF
jgi:hypothetical protein